MSRISYQVRKIDVERDKYYNVEFVTDHSSLIEAKMHMYGRKDLYKVVKIKSMWGCYKCNNEVEISETIDED